MSGAADPREQPPLRLGIVGLGHIGSRHARSLLCGAVVGARLSAVADTDARSLVAFADLPRFADGAELVDSGLVDAVVVATPHFTHVPLALEALARGLAVLIEKPIAAHKADAERLLSAFRERPSARQLLAVGFGFRADPRYLALRTLLGSGEFGAVRRIHWTSTNWLRGEAYYRDSPWRGTWRGEGGGVLLNQASHTLDLWQWLFGMPQRLRAFCGFGRSHPIEVEDEVTAYLEYEDGKTGVFVASTGEAWGTNRLEIIAERGRLVLDHETLEISPSPTNASAVSSPSLALGGHREREPLHFPALPGPELQRGLLQNFVDALRGTQPLLAPAAEGLASLELANAMLLSSLRAATVTLPLDAADYESELARLIARSRTGP